MRTKKRAKITIETDRIVVISQRRLSARAWCVWCGKLVRMVSVDDAAKLARVSSRTIYRWAEDARLHFTETSDGRLLVCSESISAPGKIIP